MTYTKLPYDFDLHFDIKSVEQLHNVLIEDSLESYHDMSDLFELIDHHNIPLPEGYKRPFKVDFPAVVWIDNNGCYIDHVPECGEEHRYQKMKRF